MYEVKLASFEGPLDLLLHLIKKFEIDIYDISMKLLTEQYFQYMNQVQDLDLNQHGEYLVMASELLRIKSRTLLPNEPVEDEIYEDPREDLVRQLLEYQNYKFYADVLKDKQLEKSKTFIKRSMDLSKYESKSLPSSLELTDLIQAYNKARTRVVIKEDEVSVSRENYTIEMAIEKVLSILNQNHVCYFHELVTFRETKEQIVTLFLAILELMKEDKIIVTQNNLFENIKISKGAAYENK